MSKLTEHRRNLKRYERMSKRNKALANIIALEEFNKPVNYRCKPVDVLDMIDFTLKKNKP